MRTKLDPEEREILESVEAGEWRSVATFRQDQRSELPLRITVLHPVPGVTHRLQQGRLDLVPPVVEADDRLSFDFTLRVVEGPAGEPVLRGPCAQGPPAGRFVYINSGTSAGQ
ncbi:MAG TPA: DUF5990 family protein, partial [Thermoanaerobaculia bacterium]|nr:DUF5990 family protein [Thermoanaerobaculia bacterium]